MPTNNSNSTTSAKQYKRMPFDIELAKKIQSGEVEGRIITNNDREVTILCFNRKSVSSAPIVALIHYNSYDDHVHTYSETGYISDIEEKALDLFIEFPEEAPKHEFKPFDKVLVRNMATEWIPKFYSRICILDDGTYQDGYMTTDDKRYRYCIPYEGNQHLVGTTKNPE